MAPLPRHKVIRGGMLLDIRKHRADPRDILIDGDTISAIGEPGMEAPADAQVVDATRRLMHPGLINAHTHGHGVLSKGLGDRWTLELLLVYAPWSQGKRQLEDKYLCTFVGALEMLMKGCTACYDLTAEVPYPTFDGLRACADAYRDAGMRAVIAPMVADRTFYQSIPRLIEAFPEDLKRTVEGFSMAPAKEALAIMRKTIVEWSHDRDLVKPAVAPAIPHQCSEEFLCGCRDLAREFSLGVHTHIQETKIQVMTALECYGKTQAAHLDDIGMLDAGFTAAHGVWLNNDDMLRLGKHGASVVHNPSSNMRLGSGIADVRGMLAAGVNVGLGTDGANSSDNLNMYEAMRLASLCSKVRGPDIDQWLTTEEVLEAATVGGAKALGWGDKIGKIAVGYKADIVFIDLDHPNWMPHNDPTNQLVHSEDATAVHSVMVGGVLRVENRRPVGVDLAKLAQSTEAARSRIHSSRSDTAALVDALAQVVNAHCLCFARRHYPINRYASDEHL